MFAELVLEFKKMAQLTDEDKPSFSFNGNQIKGDSCKTLEELGIFGGAVIMVTGVNRPNMQNNAGNFAMGNQGFYQNQGMGNMPSLSSLLRIFTIKSPDCLASRFEVIAGTFSKSIIFALAICAIRIPSRNKNWRSS